MASLSVKVAAKMSGVSAHTIRAWERRYQAVSPGRLPSGRRVYDYKDVERLGLLSNLVELGHSISSVAKLSEAELRDLIEKDSSRIATQERGVQRGGASASLQQWIATLISDVEEFRMDRLYQNLAEARFHLSTKDLVLEVIPKVFDVIGENVACDQMSISQEHAFSAVLRDHLAQIFRGFEQKNYLASSKKCVVLATPEGELHEFGTLMSAILCAIHGYSTHYLGPNLPASDLAYAASAVKASLIILGISPHTQRKDDEISKYLSKLRKGLPNGAEVWMGGKGCPAPRQLKVRIKPQVIDTLETLTTRLASRS